MSLNRPGCSIRSDKQLDWMEQKGNTKGEWKRKSEGKRRKGKGKEGENINLNKN